MHPSLPPGGGGRGSLLSHNKLSWSRSQYTRVDAIRILQQGRQEIDIEDRPNGYPLVEANIESSPLSDTSCLLN